MMHTVWYTRKTGAGAGEEQGVQDDIDVYFQLLQNQWLTLVLLLQLTKTLSTI
jgi:hypothetical protein